MERAECRRLRQVRRWAAKFGLSIVRARSHGRSAPGWCFRDQHKRPVSTGTVALTLDDIAKELLKREKRES